VLEQLADHIERDYLLTSKIKGAMYYPAFVVGAIILVIIIMIVFVLPQMTGMLKELGAELPLPTQIVINVSNFVIDNGLMILVLLVGIGFGLFRYFKTPNGKSLKDKIEVKIPVIGPLFQNIYLARIAENLGSLVKSGIPIVEALDTISLVIGNTLYEDVLKKARDNVRKGGTISEVFKDSSVIPSTLSQMVAAGESSGNLDKVLISLAKFYNTEVDTTVENLMSLLDPILMVGLGLGVGFIAAAVLLPMYNLSGAL
jgi:type IV pilus assembly protein PilC